MVDTSLISVPNQREVIMCWLTNVTFLLSPDTSFTFFLLSPGHWLSYLILLIKKRCITVSCTHCTYWTLYTLYTLWIQSVSHTGLFPGTYSESIQFQLQSSHQNTYTVQIVLEYWFMTETLLLLLLTDKLITDTPSLCTPDRQIYIRRPGSKESLWEKVTSLPVTGTLYFRFVIRLP